MFTVHILIRFVHFCQNTWQQHMSTNVYILWTSFKIMSIFDIPLPFQSEYIFWLESFCFINISFYSNFSRDPGIGRLPTRPYLLSIIPSELPNFNLRRAFFVVKALKTVKNIRNFFEKPSKFWKKGPQNSWMTPFSGWRKKLDPGVQSKCEIWSLWWHQIWAFLFVHSWVKRYSFKGNYFRTLSANFRLERNKSCELRE